MKNYKKKEKTRNWYLYMSFTNNPPGSYKLPMERTSFKKFYNDFNNTFTKAKLKEIKVVEGGKGWLVLSIRGKDTAKTIETWLEKEGISRRLARTTEDVKKIEEREKEKDKIRRREPLISKTRRYVNRILRKT